MTKDIAGSQTKAPVHRTVTRSVVVVLMLAALVSTMPQQADAATGQIKVSCDYRTSQFLAQGSVTASVNQPVAWKIQWRTYIPGRTPGPWVTDHKFLYSMWVPVGRIVVFTPSINHIRSTVSPTSIQVRMLFYRWNGANWGQAQYQYASLYTQYANGAKQGSNLARCLT